MYAREIEGKPLTLEASGALYKDALVMYDRETQSLWTQVDGSAMRGPLAGKKLKPIPSVETSWGEWKRQHPDTLVLAKPPNLRGTPYTRYFNDPNAFGISGRQQPDPRLPGKVLVVGVRQGTEALAVSLTALEKKLFVETALGREPLLVVYDAQRKTARVFRRRLGGQVLKLEVAARPIRARQPGLLLEDRQGNRWDALTGKAVSGPQAGAALEPVPYMVSYWWAWSAYSPRTCLER